MKRSLQTTALAAALALTPLAALHAAESTDQSATTETRTLAPFSAINLAGAFDVVITGAGAPAVELSGPRKALAEIETSVSGDTLTVRQPKRKGWTINLSFGRHKARWWCASMPPTSRTYGCPAQGMLS